MAAAELTGGQNVSQVRGFPRLLLLAWLSLAVVLLGMAGWTALFGTRADSQPAVTFDISAPAKMLSKGKTSRRTADINLIGAGKQPTAMPAQTPNEQTKVPASIVPANIAKPIYAGANLVADPGLIEPTPAGPLPRIADDGRSPMNAYAPPVPNVQGPRIAIVVTGLGVSAKATQAAIANLPAAITLAFLPYADDVQRWVSEARRRGHEVLLEVPMEPYDFPDSDPGPHTLRASSGEDSNIDRLTWSLTRFTGYAGVTNLLGARFMADPSALEPVMTFLARRGLVFFDAGPVSRSSAPDVAKRIGAPYVQSATNIDAIQTGMEIDQRLSELEARARLNGSAAGTAFVYPVTIERLTSWAQGLSGRGFVLVPASAIVPASSK
ncbi:MAG: divergent polysaccharide deacetylase family protein [Proteobacteria bacterium]|nr:divergent polysaccharide deacetylase family protein [Pseudomonadota bacterium]